MLLQQFDLVTVMEHYCITAIHHLLLIDRYAPLVRVTWTLEAIIVKLSFPAIEFWSLTYTWN